QIVCELVECAAGAEVEARVVPVTRENAVADRPPVERKAHVRAAVVNRVDVVAFGEQADGVPVDVDDEPAGRPYLGQRRYPAERFRIDGRHVDSLEPQVWFTSSAATG